MIVVHHNPRCGTSRNVVHAVRSAGEEPVLIDYLSEGWTRPQLLGLLAAMGLTPRQAARASEAAGVGLDLAEADPDDILDAMIAHPVLVQRPIVCGPNGVVLCRPKERVWDVLGRMPDGPVFWEDGRPALGPDGARLA